MNAGAQLAAPQWIGVSLGDLPALEGGGLGEFCLQIGQRLARRLGTGAPGTAGRWRLAFHVKPALRGCFGDGVEYLPVSRWHRWRHATPQRFALWHSLHQLNKNLPPQGTAVRLLTVHDLNYQHGNGAVSRWRHQGRMRALLRRTDALATISAFTAADVRRHLGWTRPISVIHNGARSLVDAPQAPLEGWPMRPTRPFLFHLSRLSPVKNPTALLALAAAWPEMCFVIAGPANADATALRAATRLPNVQFHLGLADAQKAWAYAHCAGFLFPSLAEGFGLPPIEAMHFGKPVFLSRLTSLPEVGGEAAEYFDSFDGPTMRAVVEQGLARHAQDPQRARQLTERAAGFSWDTAADAYVALYRRLLEPASA